MKNIKVLKKQFEDLKERQAVTEKVFKIVKDRISSRINLIPQD